MNNFSIVNLFLFAFSFVLFSYKRNVTENNKQVSRDIKSHLELSGKVNQVLVQEVINNSFQDLDWTNLFIFYASIWMYVCNCLLQMLSDIEIESVILEQRRENVAVCESHVNSLISALSEIKESFALESSEKKIAEIKQRNPKWLRR